MNRHRLSDPLLRLQPDERLAALAAHGGERAFAVLVERHRPRLVAFARRGGAGAAAEDVVQQALLQAWAALGRGAQVEHVSAWLHRIVRNAGIRAAATAADGVELPATLVAATDTAGEVEMRQRTIELLKEIERLPPRQREALLRLAVDGSSGEQIGREMALEANAVRQLAHRARTRLRMAMGALVPWPLALWAARSSAAGIRFAGGVPELAGGAGATTGIVKLGAIASTTAVVAAGAAGIVPRVSHRPHGATPAGHASIVAATVPTLVPVEHASTPTVVQSSGGHRAHVQHLHHATTTLRRVVPPVQRRATHEHGERPSDDGSRQTRTRVPASGEDGSRDGGSPDSTERHDGDAGVTTTPTGDDGSRTGGDGGGDGSPGPTEREGSDGASGTTTATTTGDG
jgi:RNA polymerase sigma factor (sigma-70 family)